ncbi:MAG: DUF3601 domain-containing protein [Pseudomonadota bacterium]
MDQAYPSGHWTARLPRQGFKHLKPGRRYEVTAPFTDYDGDLHPAGERWRFLTHNFLPYEDGLSLFVSLDDAQEWHIRLQWRPETQAAIIDALEQHLRACEG